LNTTDDSSTKIVPKRRGIERLLFTLVNSGRAVRYLLRNEAAFQQELALACVLIPVAIFLSTTAVEFALLVGSVIAVLVVEVLNTAIEVVINRIGLESNTLSGLAKDLGPAAVTLALILWAVVWGSIVSSYWITRV